MREIKFRLWNEDSKIMTSADNLFIDAYYESGDGCVVNKWFNQKGKIFMQYTGLKDKNGKEIYEGDIVVDWNTGIKDKSSSPYVISYEQLWTIESLYPDQFPMVEVIGNIYENPELLKELEVKK